MVMVITAASVDKHQKEFSLARIQHSRWQMSILNYCCGGGRDHGDDVGFGDYSANNGQVLMLIAFVVVVAVEEVKSVIN